MEGFGLVPLCETVMLFLENALFRAVIVVPFLYPDPDFGLPIKRPSPYFVQDPGTLLPLPLISYKALNQAYF